VSQLFLDAEYGGKISIRRPGTKGRTDELIRRIDRNRPDDVRAPELPRAWRLFWDKDVVGVRTLDGSRLWSTLMYLDPTPRAGITAGSIGLVIGEQAAGRFVGNSIGMHPLIFHPLEAAVLTGAILARPPRAEPYEDVGWDIPQIGMAARYDGRLAPPLTVFSISREMIPGMDILLPLTTSLWLRQHELGISFGLISIVDVRAN
jgi:hypothetical protein